MLGTTVRLIARKLLFGGQFSSSCIMDDIAKEYDSEVTGHQPFVSCRQPVEKFDSRDGTRISSFDTGRHASRVTVQYFSVCVTSS